MLFLELKIFWFEWIDIYLSTYLSNLILCCHVKVVQISTDLVAVQQTFFYNQVEYSREKWIEYTKHHADWIRKGVLQGFCITAQPKANYRVFNITQFNALSSSRSKRQEMKYQYSFGWKEEMSNFINISSDAISLGKCAKEIYIRMITEQLVQNVAEL